MILTSVFVVYALVASRLDRLSITAPMVFVVAGVLLGRSVTDQLHLSLTSEPVLLIVELTLALLLFADASTVRLSEVEGRRPPPVGCCSWACRSRSHSGPWSP